VPLQVEIINYLYYKSNQLLTPSTGYTNTTDYTLSNKVSLTILLVFQGFTSSSEVDALTSFIESNAFPAYMQYVLPVQYNGNKYAVTVDHHSHTTATQNVAEPIELTSSASYLSSASMGLLAWLTMMGLMGLYWSV
jgi:hypothetical protein